MNQPTKRKTMSSASRARSNSARLSANDKKSKAAKKSNTYPGVSATGKKYSHTVSGGKKSSVKKPSTSSLSSFDTTPVLWTKGKSSQKEASGISGGFGKAAEGFSWFGRALAAGVAAIGGFFVSLASKSKLFLGILLLVLVLVGGCLIDLGLNWGKIYQGVHIGEIDLSGKTANEAQSLLEEAYTHRLVEKKVYIYANEDAKTQISTALKNENLDAESKQQLISEAMEQKQLWIVDATNLGATLDVGGMVDQAMAQGRENGGLFARIQTHISGFHIEPRAKYNTESVESIASAIDSAIGEPRVNFNVSILEGNAVVTDGHDGNMINRDSFLLELDQALLSEDGSESILLAHTEYSPVQISEEQAQEVCDIINNSIKYGTQFIYKGIGWNANAIEVGNWVQTRVVESNDGYLLEPYINYDLAKGSIQSHLKASFESDQVVVHFSKTERGIIVNPKTEGVIPQSKKAIQLLDSVLFDKENPPTETPIINVGSVSIPNELTLQEALDYGVVEIISEYTTEYSTDAENRNHNIHLAASLLNESIVPAEGGIWSFNEIAGDCNEEAGFKGATTIINNQYVDEIGGGVCQVATTVFNAVFESGFPIELRYNHSLYSSTYPAGRDAAISWPDLDLKWKNDSTSDVLVLTSYTDYSITVSLYGINPEYQVSSHTGEWEAGEEYKTITKVDETLAPGEKYTKTYGINGSKITVYRTVTDKSGNVLSEDTFYSNYTARDEIVVEGPKAVEEQKTN